MAKKTKLGYAHLGNGVSIWRLGKGGNYIAHISNERKVSFDKRESFTEEEVHAIEKMATEIEVTVSYTQRENVLTPPPILTDPGMGKMIALNKVLYRGFIYMEINGKWTKWSENEFK